MDNFDVFATLNQAATFIDAYARTSMAKGELEVIAEKLVSDLHHLKNIIVTLPKDVFDKYFDCDN